MAFFTKLGLRTKVAAMMVIGLIALTAAIFWQVRYDLLDDAARQAQKRMEISIAVARDVMADYGTGYNLENGALRIGDRDLQDFNEPVDRVQELTGSLATIFQGDLRIATNVLKADGSRAVGTRLTSEPVIQSVLRDGRAFNGEADILGLPYFVTYDPIVDDAGKVIGVLFVGVGKEQFMAPIKVLLDHMMVASGLILLLVAGLTYALTGPMFRPLRTLRQTVERIAGGNLTAFEPSRSGDEIGQLHRAMAAMARQLSEIVEEVRLSASHVTSASAQSTETAEQLSSGSTQQASATSEASAAIEQMAANVRQNAENAKQTETIAERSAQEAEESGRAVSRSSEAMQHISAKVRIVQEIARQTDLLALNAAIEAARAGNHGKGFSVVAAEVRKLAERSQQAAGEISELSTRTLGIADEAATQLDRLVPDIRRTAELVSEISAACREQSIGAEQINQAIAQLDEVTQRNSDAATEMASTAAQLSGEAGRLNTKVDFFQTDRDGPVPETASDSESRTEQNVHNLQDRARAFAGTSRPAARQAPRPVSPARPDEQFARLAG